MSEISAKLVKELRLQTGAGMMECKKSLVECSGNLEEAIKLLRVKGGLKAEKVAGRDASEGRIYLHINEDQTAGAIMEINCETDFVAKDEQFTAFCAQVGNTITTNSSSDLQELNQTQTTNEGQTVEELRHQLIQKLGENVNIRRFVTYSKAQQISGYVHHSGKIGVLLRSTNASAALTKDICLHIAANQPKALAQSDLDQNLIEKEKEIFIQQAMQSGKSEEIAQKMVGGKIKKFVAESTLLAQPFVKNPQISVQDHIASETNAQILGFDLYVLGE